MEKITVIGGDLRMRTAFTELKNHGFLMDSSGLFDEDTADIASSDVLLLPVPTTRDGITVNAPLTERHILLSYIEDNAKDKLVLTGNCKINAEHCIDYCKNDSYSIKNAVPTAEGAIAAAIQNTPFILSGSNVLVIGYGRIGKILANRLKGMSAEVTAAARKESDLAYAEASGLKSVHSAEIHKFIESFDIIFNTADAKVPEKSLIYLKNKTVIDLSSLGCISGQQASDYGIKYTKLPGLPGKTSPQTAGKILAETVISILKEHRQN